METESTERKRYRFANLRLDVGDKILRRSGEIVPLPAKVMDVLCLLVERRGALVTKNELMETVWADLFVEESNLTQSIYSLRKTLGSDSDGRAIIETIPKRGYRIAVDVDVDVEERSTAEQPPLAMPRSAMRMRVAYGLAGVAAIVAIVGSIVLAARYLSLSTPSVEKVKFQKLTFSGDVAFPVISPDGKSFAYVKENAINLQDIATGSSFKLNIPEHAKFGNLQFSNEGETIYFRDESSSDTGGNIYQVSRFGGQPKLVAEKAWSGVDLSPDAAQIAFIRFYPNQGEWALMTKKLGSGEESTIISRNLPYSLYRSGFPAWSPDGRRIAIVEQTPDQAISSRILLVDTGSKLAETLETPRFVQIEQVDWLPQNNGLLITGRENNRFFQLWHMSLAGGETHPITNDLNIYRNLSVSADGRNLLARQFTVFSHIWTAPADDLKTQRQITFGNLNRDGSSGISWMPDGRIVYSTRITGNIDLWAVNPTNGVRNQLTDNAGTNNENPFVSADGRSIFFESTRSGRRHIWRSDTDGGNAGQITFADNETDFLPVVSPAGDALYYIQRNPKSNVLWRQSLIDGRRDMLTQQGKLSPGSFLSISPDGRFLAFQSIRDDKKGDRSEIILLDLVEGGEPRSLTIASPDAHIVWAQDGRAVDYCENRAETCRFWRQPLDGTERTLLFELPRERLFGFAWSNDYKTLALARGRQENDAMLLTGF